MRRISVFLLIIICFLCISGCKETINQEKHFNIEDKSDILVDYEVALKKGGEILKEKFPNVVNENSEFVAYKLDNIWHIQNILFNDAEHTYTPEGKMFTEVEKVRYVKMNEDFSDILLIGEYNMNNVINDSNVYGVTNFSSARKILSQIMANKYNSCYKREYTNILDGEYMQVKVGLTSEFYNYLFDNGIAIAGGPENSNGELTIRKKDGVIVFFCCYFSE